MIVSKGKHSSKHRATWLVVAFVVGTCWTVSVWTSKDIKDFIKDVAPGGSQDTMVPKCSQAQRDALFETFRLETDGLSTCPDEPWINFYFGQQVHPHYLGVNVGCNKGTDAIHMARVLSRDADLSADKWMDTLEQSDGAVCGLPKQDPIPAHVVPGDATGIAPSTGKVHCIEAIQATHEALNKAAAKLGHKYEQALIISHAAVSNTSGKALFPTGCAGAEAFSLANCYAGDSTMNPTMNPTADECEEVDMFTLDDYMQKQQALGNAGTSPQQPIDLLLIDVEGFDYEVLQGAKESIKRARYLSFEVHSVPNWPDNSLMHAVDHMLEDFVCYWAGKNKLWHITDCVDDRLVDIYENHKVWSNVACASKSEPKLVAIMEHIFQYDTLRLFS